MAVDTAHLSDIESQGFTIVPDVVSSDAVDRLNHALLSAMDLAETPGARTSFSAPKVDAFSTC